MGFIRGRIILKPLFSCEDLLQALVINRKILQLYLLLFSGKGALYSYDVVGSYEREKYRAGGSSSAILQPFLDSQVGPERNFYFLSCTSKAEFYNCVLFTHVLRRMEDFILSQITCPPNRATIIGCLVTNASLPTCAGFGINNAFSSYAFRLHGLSFTCGLDAVI